MLVFISIIYLKFYIVGPISSLKKNIVKTLLFIVPNLYFIIIYPPKPAGSGPGQAGAGGFFFANKRFFLANKRFFLAKKRFFLAKKRFFLANKRFFLPKQTL